MDAVPETFVDAFGEISLKHGMIRIELVSLSGSEPRVTQRLITSLQAFSQMLQAQNGMLEQLEKAGVIRPPQPSPAAESAPAHASLASWGGNGRRWRRCGGWLELSRCRSPQGLRPDKRPAATALGPPKSPNFSDELIG